MPRSPLSELGQRIQEPAISWLMRLTLSRPNLVSLAAGFTDNASLPVRETRRLAEKVLSQALSGQRALQYGSTAGDPSLRALTARHLRTEDRGALGKAVPAQPYDTERMLITHGSQQLLYIATESLCDTGDIVLVEDPTYFVYLGILQSRAIRTRGIRLEQDGIDLVHLEQVLESLVQSGDIRRLKMLYLVTYFQNPSSVTTSFAKKKAALELLRRYERHAGHPIYLLEDAAYRELRFSGADEASGLCAPGGADRVIYAGTYSKPFATGARVGFGLLPEPVYTACLRIKGNHDFGTANLLQTLLAEALSSGAYAAHLPRLRARYAKKAGIMVEALRRHFPESVTWAPPRGGLYVWAEAPRGVQTGTQSAFFRKALKAEVLYVPGDLCYAPDGHRRPSRSSLRLSFGGAKDSVIETGVERLGRLFNKAT